MKQLSLLVCSMVIAACAHQGVQSASSTSANGQRMPASGDSSAGPRSASDPSLKQGDLTVWKLQEMAQKKQYDQLNALFNGGVSLDSLPVGYAAGAGARVLDLPTELGITVLDDLTGRSWRGKIFFKSGDPRESHGLNRINEDITGFTKNILPMGAFTTSLLDHGSLVPDVTSNFVVLNYAHPKTKPYWLEIALLGIQVYDVMVAVPGKYGPVYVGKTWLGRYDQSGNFSPFETSILVAWYFLDFNADALADQMANHWDKSVETLIDYGR